MDIKKLEEMFEPSAMKMARGNQARLDSLHLATGATDNLLKIAKGLDCSKRLTENIAIQDLSSQDFPQNNLAIDKSIAGIIKSLAESNSINKSLFESIKLNTALIDAFGATHLGFKPITQTISVKGISPISQVGELGSITSKITEIFKHYEQFRGLESFKALSRMKNFPLKDVVINNFDNLPELDYDFDRNVLEIDSEISEEVSLIDDFNELSEEKRTTLLDLYQAYYYPILVNCLILLILLKIFLDEKIDLSNNIFVFVESTKGALCYIGNNIYQPNPSAIIDGFIGGALLMLLVKIFGK